MPQHDLTIIGAGPGGYVAAIRGAQLGFNVAIIEKEPALGGTCLRIGCIPSKALLESSERYWEARHELDAHGIHTAEVALDLQKMLTRKDDVVMGLTSGVKSLMDKNRITIYRGHARLDGPGRVVVHHDSPTESARPATTADSTGEFTLVESPHIILATGSKPARLAGVEFQADRIATSTEALSFKSVPRHLVVIGAGYIGLELGSVWCRLGAKVTVLEYLDRILPGMDSELAAEALKIFRKQGLEFRLGTRVTAARVDGKVCTVEREDAEPLQCERVLVAIGRTPNTDRLGLETVGIALDAKGRIPVNSVSGSTTDSAGPAFGGQNSELNPFATSAAGIYAIGDLIRGPMLAHKAEDEGVACVEHIVTGHAHINYDAIPGVVYTSPEIASVGRTEDELKAGGYRLRASNGASPPANESSAAQAAAGSGADVAHSGAAEYRKGVFHFRANPRARCIGHTEGRIKILADAVTDRILGVHIIGPRAGDLIAEAATAIEFGASSEDLARTPHAHPSLAECLREAALAVDGRAIHA